MEEEEEERKGVRERGGRAGLLRERGCGRTDLLPGSHVPPARNGRGGAEEGGEDGGGRKRRRVEGGGVGGGGGDDDDGGGAR